MSIPLPTGPRLSGGQTTLDLGGSADKLLLAPGTEALELTFGLETTSPIDYLEIVLQHLGSELTTVRTYIVDKTSPEVVIDHALLQPGNEYVFAIRTHRGKPLAAEGDHRHVAYPQSVATTYTRTFIAQ